ncbi:MAG: hypothetical protein QGG36_12315 [Pirellulaceae bacterium]|nr:hypothetical protein [Pirellulaceae bacterium]MDP7016580.1 hypothetical protein [Pirellulaceae bacterium]
MRRLLFATLLCVSMSTNVGCILPIFSADPTLRTEQLIFQSENFRNILLEWERFWFVEQPDHMTPFRVHGGII